MKNILIVSYEMLPYTKYWGACQRIYYFATYLSLRGYNVSVIAGRNTLDKNFYGKDVTFKTIHLYNKWQSEVTGLSGNETKNNIVQKKHGLIHYIKQIVKKIDRILNNDPNVGMGIISSKWMNENANEIMRQISTTSIDHVILSAPPFGLLQPSLLKDIKKNIPGKLIIDYRDPWNCWNGTKGIPFIREKKIINICDVIITTNNNHKQRMISDFRVPENKIITIMNGYDDILWNSVENQHVEMRNEKLTFSYIGTISFGNNSYRNPIKLLEAYLNFEHKNDIKLRFIGLDLSQNSIEKLRQKYPDVDFIPRISQEESLLFMLKSDVLVNLHTTNDTSSTFLIGGKLFDYYRSKRYILSINSKTSFEHSFIKEKEIGLCVENNTEEINEALNAIYQQWKTKINLINKSGYSDILYYSRKHFNEKLLELL